jgi:RNA polymerase sigma-70 factor (ECF subfamily)
MNGFVHGAAAVECQNPVAAVSTWYEYHQACPDRAIFRVSKGGPTLVEPGTPKPLETTFELLDRMRRGDRDALDRLFERSLPALRRWARGRLPAAARGALDTQDLVQDTVLNSLRHLNQFESRHEGALQAYLRQAVLNRIRDEARKITRRPAAAELTDSQPAHSASPLEIAIGREGVERYERALLKLRPADREAIVGRLELQYDYQELAVLLGKPNANAARVAVTRALARLMEQFDDG